MELDKSKLNSDLIELVGATLHSFENQLSGKYPGEYNIEDWRGRYMGLPGLPPPYVQLNTFRMLVDQTVSNILTLVDQAKINP